VSAIHEKAMEALRETQGDRVKAAALFRQWVEEDEALYRELLEPLVNDAIWQAIRLAGRVMRTEVWSVQPLPSERGPRGSVAGLVAMAETRMQSLLDDFRLPSGIALGDATIEHVVAAAMFYHGQARGNKVKARFLDLVGAAMGNAKQVRDRLSDKKLRDLQARAEQEEDGE